MKPKYIFSAVFAICVMMLTVLPQLGRPKSATAAQPAAITQPAAIVQQGAVSKPAISGAAAAAPTIAPTLAPAPKTEQQSAPPVVKGNEILPSPADNNASPGQGLSAIPETSGQPDLDAFIASVQGGAADQLSGVYVPGMLALRIVQQPAGDVNYVDVNDGTATEYSRADAYHVIGLLAHNTLNSGKSFFKLKTGQEVILVYGDGRQARYRIDRIENYQALGPNDPYSDFIDLNGPGGSLVRNEELFQRIYTNSGNLVFQTCFEANGDPSWGRMFVVAQAQ